ncbi:2OG-Fe(II) oxygenase superfamily protein [Aspergillus cavernicola]|uniref:2OG-Fe(II) oxygenase superfamily protein n=1 Tax=Aspergillus cavernicola TaxID=176166 RepID=A0ABR4HQZ9_9EURO
MAEYTQLELRTLNGPEYRRVSTAPPRIPTADEIPIIDLTPIDGDLDARKQIASKIRAAAENTGFFYIKNHGIPEELIQRALHQAQSFFNQSAEEKEKVSHSKSKHNDGYHGVGTTQINNKESRDQKETFSVRYNPQNDPTTPLADSDSVPDTTEEHIWSGTNHLPDFRTTTIQFYKSRLTLARKIIRLFALALDLPEDYFDSVTTHPGADALYVHYPGTPSLASTTTTTTKDISTAEIDVGIGSHTDIQCVTLLWQDTSGGLQVLSASDEWLDARPIEGTLVVNIGDFLQRLSNNRFKSTVHRVYNRQSTSRYSMPFFLGFNPESVCRVVPTCVGEGRGGRALYEPISCGEWHRARLALASQTTTAS